MPSLLRKTYDGSTSDESAQLRARSLVMFHDARSTWSNDLHEDADRSLKTDSRNSMFFKSDVEVRGEHRGGYRILAFGAFF